MSEGEVHPTIVIKVKNRNTKSHGWRGLGPWTPDNEFPFSRIFENGWSLRASNNKIDGAVVVVVGSQCSNGGPGCTQANSLGYLSECSIPVVTPHDVIPTILSVEGHVIDGKLMVPVEAGDVQVQVAVVIVVNECQP